MKAAGIVLSIFLLMVSVGSGQSISSGWTPEMQLKVKALGTPRVSPDGSKVVYTVVSEVMTADKSEYLTQIWLGSTDGKENAQLTFADKSSTNPKWSPDGKWIAFTSTRKDNKSNLYVLRVGGGEAEMLTDVKSGVTDFDWSHDGRNIAFTMTDAKSDDEDKNDKARNDFRWVDENIKLARLYVMPVAKDVNGKRDSRKLTVISRSVNGFDWSPDGTKIVFSHVSDPRAEFWPTSDISVVDIASTTVTPLVATTASESNPGYSPDGKWIAFSASDGPVHWAQSNRINIIPASGGTAKAMTISHDGQPGIIGWSTDGGKIYFNEGKGTGTSLYSTIVSSGAITEEKTGDAAISL